MREIKFRALSMCRGERWVYGDLRHYARNPHTEKWTIHDPATGLETDIDKTTIGQFTGLYDKTANELHESFVPADEEEQPKKKRPKMLGMFYALLLCVVFAVMFTCADVLVCKLLGWHCDIYSIIRSIAIAYVFFIISSLVEKI